MVQRDGPKGGLTKEFASSHEDATGNEIRAAPHVQSVRRTLFNPGPPLISLLGSPPGGSEPA